MNNTIYLEGIKGLNKEKAHNLYNWLRANYKLCLQVFLSTGDEHVAICKSNLSENCYNINEIVERINNMKVEGM